MLSYVNKYLAHAADPANRAKIDAELAKVTLGALRRMYRILIWATKLVGRIVDTVALFEVPSPQFDQFEGGKTPLSHQDPQRGSTPSGQVGSCTLTHGPGITQTLEFYMPALILARRRSPNKIERFRNLCG